jgi:hypothetical protein
MRVPQNDGLCFEGFRQKTHFSRIYHISTNKLAHRQR